MVYKINGTELTLQPTYAGWVGREVKGITGHAHPMYVGVRQYELNWGIDAQDEFDQLVTFFNSISITGSAVVDLPQWNSSTYQFFSYSGCVVHEPEFERYFTEHPTNVKLLISNIRT